MCRLFPFIIAPTTLGTPAVPAATEWGGVPLLQDSPSGPWHLWRCSSRELGSPLTVRRWQKPLGKHPRRAEGTRLLFLVRGVSGQGQPHRLPSLPEGWLEGLSHVPFLSSCLPQSEHASEEAGEGEYVCLYSSGQSSEELAPSRGVSNLGRLVHAAGPSRVGPASAWLSLQVASSLARRRLGSAGRGRGLAVASPFAVASVAWYSSSLAGGAAGNYRSSLVVQLRASFLSRLLVSRFIFCPSAEEGTLLSHTEPSKPTPPPPACSFTPAFPASREAGDSAGSPS